MNRDEIYLTFHFLSGHLLYSCFHVTLYSVYCVYIDVRLLSVVKHIFAHFLFTAIFWWLIYTMQSLYIWHLRDSLRRIFSLFTHFLFLFLCSMLCYKHFRSSLFGKDLLNFLCFLLLNYVRILSITCVAFIFN